MKQFLIIGNTYQSISTLINGKMFYTPKKGETKSLQLVEIPGALKQLADRNLISIKTQ